MSDNLLHHKKVEEARRLIGLGLGIEKVCKMAMLTREEVRLLFYEHWRKSLPKNRPA